MKRFYFLFLLLPAFGASAQTVGVNTRTPEATLDVRAGSGTTTNEGIRAPLLIKTRVAAIASPREGTLVYVKAESASTFTTYAGSDAKVAEITEPGYYFYNGTKWVKVNDEWEYDGDKLRVRTKADGTSPRTDEGNVFITNDGRLGIKTRHPDQALEVNGDVFVGKINYGGAQRTFPMHGNFLAFEGTDSYHGTWGSQKTYGNSNIFAFYRWDKSDDVSDLRLLLTDNVNATSKTVSFSIGGMSGLFSLGNYPSINHSTDYREYFRFENLGHARKVGGTMWENLSDARTKTNVSDYTPGLNELLRVRPVNYSYKAGFGIPGNYVGVLAQELEQVAPEMVRTTDDSKNGVDHIKYVDASNFTFMLINAVKTLKQENDARRRENDALQKDLHELKVAVEALRK